MEWKPDRLIALLLGFFTQFLAMFYVGRVRWALFYLLLPLMIFIAEFLISAPWLAGFTFAFLVAPLCAIHAFALAARSTPLTTRPRYSRWYGLLGIYGAYFLAIFSFRAFLFEPFRMPSGSMLPTIKVGSHMLVAKYGYGNYGSFGIKLPAREMSNTLSHGDLIVFDYPENPDIAYIKRLIGLPGDHLLYKERQLYINGSPVVTEAASDVANSDEGYLYRRETLDDKSYTVAYLEGRESVGFDVVVPPQNYFVLGDNRDNSRDSRYWGFVPQQNIVGKVIYVTR